MGVAKLVLMELFITTLLNKPGCSHAHYQYLEFFVGAKSANDLLFI